MKVKQIFLCSNLDKHELIYNFLMDCVLIVSFESMTYFVKVKNFEGDLDKFP